MSVRGPRTKSGFVSLEKFEFDGRYDSKCSKTTTRVHILYTLKTISCFSYLQITVHAKSSRLDYILLR